MPDVIDVRGIPRRHVTNFGRLICGLTRQHDVYTQADGPTFCPRCGAIEGEWAHRHPALNAFYRIALTHVDLIRRWKNEESPVPFRTREWTIPAFALLWLMALPLRIMSGRAGATLFDEAITLTGFGVVIYGFLYLLGRMARRNPEYIDAIFKSVVVPALLVYLIYRLIGGAPI